MAIVSDIRMPCMNGPQLVDRLRLERARVPVVFMSGYVGDFEWQCLPGPTTFIKKPFESLQILVTAVKQVVDAQAETETQLDIPCLDELLMQKPKQPPADALAR
jgi:CheY-like chemotaxis protein